MITEVKKHGIINGNSGAISLVFEKKNPSTYPAFSFRINLCSWDLINPSSLTILTTLPSFSTEDSISLVELIQESYKDNINNTKSFNSKTNGYSILISKTHYSTFKMSINHDNINYEGSFYYDLLIGDKSVRHGMLVRPNDNEVVLHQWDIEIGQ